MGYDEFLTVQFLNATSFEDSDVQFGIAIKDGVICVSLDLGLSAKNVQQLQRHKVAQLQVATFNISNN